MPRVAPPSAGAPPARRPMAPPGQECPWPALQASPPHPVSTSFKPPLSRVFWLELTVPEIGYSCRSGGTRPGQYRCRRKACLLVLVVRLSAMLHCFTQMRISLDHNATTPPAEPVIEAMARALRDVVGNASSVHSFGQQAKSAIDVARAAVAALIGGEASEVVFTAGGTESDNLALRGAAEALEPGGRREIVVSGIEHEAVLQTCRGLARRGWTVTVLPVDSSGVVAPESVLA